VLTRCALLTWCMPDCHAFLHVLEHKGRHIARAARRRRSAGEECVTNIQGFPMAFLISVATQQTIGARRRGAPRGSAVARTAHACRSDRQHRSHCHVFYEAGERLPCGARRGSPAGVCLVHQRAKGCAEYVLAPAMAPPDAASQSRPMALMRSLHLPRAF